MQTAPWEWAVVGFLAIEFIGFGITHFTHADLAAAQVPPWLPWPRELTLITGVLEIVIGSLLFPLSTRRVAAGAYLVLLLLYVPAVYYIMTDDAALPIRESCRRLWRVLLIPNNLLLALGAIYLMRPRV
jgi:uncharacterized membrane protein